MALSTVTSHRALGPPGRDHRDIEPRENLLAASSFILDPLSPAVGWSVAPTHLAMPCGTGARTWVVRRDDVHDSVDGCRKLARIGSTPVHPHATLGRQAFPPWRTASLWAYRCGAAPILWAALFWVHRKDIAHHHERSESRSPPPNPNPPHPVGSRGEPRKSSAPQQVSSSPSFSLQASCTTPRLQAPS